MKLTARHDPVQRAWDDERRGWRPTFPCDYLLEAMTTDVNDPDLAAVREKYVPLREARRTLNTRLQTMLPKQALKDCAEKLGIWRGGQVVSDSEDYVAVFTDYALYDYRLRGGTNAVERLWKLGEVKPGTPAHEVLEAMQAARFTCESRMRGLLGREMAAPGSARSGSLTCC